MPDSLPRQDKRDDWFDLELVHRDDIDPIAYDLIHGGPGGVEIRLHRHPENGWHFDEIVLPDGAVMGGMAKIHGSTATRLEEERTRLEARK